MVMSKLLGSVLRFGVRKQVQMEVPVSEEHENDNKANMEGASDSSDTVDAGKLCKQWEKYPIGHKLER